MVFFAASLPLDRFAVEVLLLTGSNVAGEVLLLTSSNVAVEVLLLCIIEADRSWISKTPMA